MCEDHHGTNIVPNATNMKMTVIKDVSGEERTIAVTLENSDHNTVDNSIDNSTTNNDNSTTNNDNSTTTNHITNHIHLNNFGSENTSMLTPAILTSLLNSCGHNDEVIAQVMQLLHFDQSTPENRNVYADNDGAAEATSTRIFQDGKWRPWENTDGALMVGQASAQHMLNHIERHPTKTTPYRSDDFKEFCEDLSTDIDTSQLLVSKIREKSYMVPAIHPEVLHEVPIGEKVRRL
jgi:hypothetical protein